MSNPSPIGLRPRWNWDEQRLQEIAGAMARYSEARVDIPVAWIDELREISVRLTADRPKGNKS